MSDDSDGSLPLPRSSPNGGRADSDSEGSHHGDQDHSEKNNSSSLKSKSLEEIPYPADESISKVVEPLEAEMEIPLPPDSSDSSKYSPTQAVIEDASPPASESHQQQQQLKKPIKVLGHAQAKKRLQAFSAAKLAAVTSSAVKKSPLKGVSVFSGRKDDSSKQQPTLAIASIKEEETKMREILAMNTILNEKLKTVHAITGSLPGPGPVTAIVKPTILNPEARNISEAPPAPVKTEIIKVEEKFAVKKPQKNIRKKRTSSSSSHSSRSRSRTPPRRRDRRSRTPPEKERERDRGRDRDNNSSSRRDRERELEKRRRSGSRNRDGRRRSPSPKKSRKRSRERKHRSRSRDADIGKSHTNNREGHHFKSPERKVKLSTISPPPPPPSSSSRSSKKIPSSPSAANIKDTRKSRSRSASNDNNTTSSTRRRSRSSSRDRSSRRRKSPKSKSSSKDSEKEKERLREREKEKQLERERKEKEEKREAERRRLEAAERELDKIRTSRMPEDWFEYKKYKYSIEHVREVWNLILSKELKSANKSSGGGTEEPERPASLAKAFHQSPSPIKTIQIELKNNLKRDYPAFCVQTTKQKPPVEYGCNPLSYAGYYKTREEILNEESPEIVKLLLDLINGASKTTTTPAPPVPKKSQEWFAENLKTFCPSEGSKGVVISHLYSDEEVEEAPSTKVSSKSEKSTVHKLLPPESSVPVPVSRVEPMEEQEYSSESSAETVPSPLLKTGFDKDAEHESDASGRRHRTEDDDDDVEEEDILEEIPLSKDETVTVKSSKKAEEEQRRPKKEKKKRKEKKKESSSKHGRHRRGSKKVQVESDEAESEAGSSSASEPVVEVKPSKRSKAVEVVVAVETKGKQPSSDKKKKDKRAHSKKKSSKKRRKSSSESAESEHSSSSESSGEDSPDNEKRAKKKLKKKKKSRRSSSKKGDGKGQDSPDEDRNDKGGSGGGGAGGSGGRGDESRRRDKDGGERDKDRKGKDRSKEHSKKSSKSSRRRHERDNDEEDADSGDESSSSYGSDFSTETSSSCETNSESPSPASVIRSMELDPRLEFALKEINVVESKTDESRVYDHLLKTAGVGDSSSKSCKEKYDPFRPDDKYDPFRVEDVEYQVDLFRNEPYKNPEQPRSIMDDQGTEDLLKTLDNDPMLQLVMNQHLVSAENLLASISEPMTSSVLADVKGESVLEPLAITEDTFGRKTLGQWNEIIRPESPIRCASKEHENKQRLQHTQQQATQRLLSPSPTRATGRNASPPMEPPMLNEKSREGNNPPLGLNREPAPRRSYSRSYSRSRSRSFSPPPGRRLRRSRSRSMSPRARGRSISPRARGRSISPGARGRSMSPGPRVRAMSPGVRRRSISPGARGRSISPPNARGYRRSVSHSPSPADRGGRRRRSVSHSLSPEWQRRHSRSPSPHRRPYHHRSHHHHHRERRHGYDRYHRERRGRRGYERVHDDYYNDRRPRRDEDAHHWERDRLLDPPSPDGYRRHRSYDRGMDRDRAEKDALSYEAAYRDRLYADEHNHHHHHVEKGLAYPPLPVGGGMRDASPPLRLNVADSTISDSELPDGGPAAFAVMEDDRGTRSNLKQIVLDPAVGTGTESTPGFASPPKRLSLDERLEVEMGIKLRESGPGQMDSFGYYGRNVPGTSGLALPFSQHAAPGWTDPQRAQNTPQAPPAAPKQSQAIPLGELIQVLPAQMLDRSFTVTKDLSGLNPFEVQQTAAQVIRKAGDVVDPSKCISVKVPVLPFKIPVFSHPDPDIFVDKENREEERRQRRERKRLEDKKKQYERKRQLAKKKLLEKKMARLARKKQLESQQDANKNPVVSEEEKKTEPEEKNQVTDSMGDENSSSKEVSTAVSSADKPQAMKNEQVPEVESKPTVADTPAETDLVKPPEESVAAEVKAETEVTKASKKEETGANESSLEQENKQAAPVLPIQLKGILYITGLKKEKSSKGVKFADGILPGDGSSLSEAEEIHSPPPIPGGVKKRKKKMKSSRKKEKKLKQQQKPEGELKQNEPLLLPPPPPPPTSSYPYCPLGLLYQFNPPYAIVYAQSMAELGFEITFTPSMEAPRGFAGEEQVKEESADVLQQCENKASGEPISPVAERSSSSHRELKKKRKERRKADAKPVEDQASESSSTTFKEPKERPPQAQSIPTIVSVKPAAKIKGPPFPTKSHNFQAPDAVRIELANEVQEGPAPRTVGGGVPAEDKSDESMMELCDPAPTNTPVENTIHVLTKNSRIENHRVHRISSGAENHRKSTKYYESKSLAKYGESYQNHRNEYRRVERIHTERKSSESKPPRTDSGNPNLIRISPSREIPPASELEAGKNVVFEGSKTPELDADGSAAVFNHEKLATPIPIISRGNQPIKIKMNTKQISRPAASPVSFGLNHQERPSEHNKSSSSSLVTIHPAESTSSPSVLSPMLSSVPREVQVNGPEFDVVAAAGSGTYSAPTRLTLSNASLDSPVQPSLPPVFSAATKIPDVRISSSSRRLPFKSNRN